MDGRFEKSLVACHEDRSNHAKQFQWQTIININKLDPFYTMKETDVILNI